AVVATQAMNVAANAKVVDLAENLFTQNISTATSISYSSDREVVGFQLNGSTGGMMLDALPALAGAAPAACSPEIINHGPDPIGIPTPDIRATIRSVCGVDIDQSTIEMIFDSAPVSPIVTVVSGSEIRLNYFPLGELPTFEEFEVTVRAQDVNGASVELTWEFQVRESY
ncbi:MAG: hypothetical protein JRJ17_06620, partial [Deltaproteobacteria bacterium]|nr:hypothetical protein [Deltaproteobacteria bacterium]